MVCSYFFYFMSKRKKCNKKSTKIMIRNVFVMGNLIFLVTSNHFTVKGRRNMKVGKQRICSKMTHKCKGFK